jgi:hypothetical protein
MGISHAGVGREGKMNQRIFSAHQLAVGNEQWAMRLVAASALNYVIG